MSEKNLRNEDYTYMIYTDYIHMYTYIHIFLVEAVGSIFTN